MSNKEKGNTRSTNQGGVCEFARRNRAPQFCGECPMARWERLYHEQVAPHFMTRLY